MTHPKPTIPKLIDIWGIGPRSLDDLVAQCSERPMTHPKPTIPKLTDIWEERSKVA